MKLDEAGSPLAPLLGTFEFIFLGMVLHVIDWETKRTFLEHFVRLLKPQAGVLINERAVGDLKGTTGGDVWAGNSFRHSDKTFKKLWGEIEGRTVARSECKVLIENGVDGDKGTWTWDLKTSKRFEFEVQRMGWKDTMRHFGSRTNVCPVHPYSKCARDPRQSERCSPSFLSPEAGLLWRISSMMPASLASSAIKYLSLSIISLTISIPYLS